MATAYIAKIPEFTGKDNNTSPQEWLDKVQKAGNANANKSSFLLSNAAVNKQKAITAIYTEAEVEEKPIWLILDSRLAGSIITYQLIQQLQRTVNRPAQTVIVTADEMKKTSANVNLDWETQELKISYQGQYTRVFVTCSTFNKKSEKASVFEFKEEKELPVTETFMALGSTSNWAEKTEQKIFEKTRRWNVVQYSTPEPKKQPPYIPLKCRDCKKKLLLIEAYIFSKEKYETCICYFCKACYRKRFGYSKKSEKWNNTLCLTCGDTLPEECNWIDVAIRGRVCDQTCQYALSISEKVKRGTPFDAAYNSAFNKLYYYLHNAEIIFDLAMALINGATKENVCQIKKAEYIEYTMELVEFNYKNECLKYYALSISLPSENNQEEIEFGKLKTKKEIATTPIYLIENQFAIQLKYFDNNEQGIKPEKAHKIDTGYDLRYSGKNILVLQPKFLTKINLKIALEILPGAIVQIAF
ncbi:hypothetical protein G9A89_007072 [Geosiphon pyriformis]|nr:hypothetical protein G9A89_007072 [Geosiphon pyriformis]